MNTLEKYLVDSILNEDTKQQLVVAYAGRFQPFHSGHYIAYQNLVKKFGAKSVYIVTSNVTDTTKSPFTFKEKKQIMTKMFKIPSSHIVQIKNPFAPSELLNKFPKDKAVLVSVVGNKDKDRLANSKYFQKLPKNTNQKLKTYLDGGYYYVTPKSTSSSVSGTLVRNTFKSNGDKESFFKKIYGKFDKAIYDLVNDKLNEGIIITPELIDEFLQSRDVREILQEASSGVGADDGPGFVYRSYKDFEEHSARRAQEIGYTAMNYIMDPDTVQNTIDYPRYPDGPVGEVAFGPKGVVPAPVENERPERNIIRNQNTFTSWHNHVKRFTTKLGYEIVDFIGAKDALLNFSDAFLDDLNLDTETNFAVNMNESVLITEGGAHGHMNHPFDDMNLTFNDLKRIVELGLSGHLDVERGASEKTDGQNLMISWKNGKLIAARNKGHLKNFGENAPDTNGIKQMFSGRGAISDAFTFAMQDLEKAISSLSEKQRNKIFAEGHKFMSLEVIFPATTNVIPYDSNISIFHGTRQYDKDANIIGQDVGDSKLAANMIKQVNQNIQKTFKIDSLPIVKLPRSKTFDKSKSLYISRLDKLKSQFKLRDSDKVSMYHQAWWEDFITRNAKKYRYSIPNNVLVPLIQRWAFFNKSFSIGMMKKTIKNPKFLEWVLKFDKQNHLAQAKKNIEPFELLFLKLGAEILLNIEPMIAVNPNKSVRKMQKALIDTVKELQSSKDVNKLKKLKRELSRLEAIGGAKVIVPMEGLVFTFKGGTYKLSGSFAPLNQLMGMLKF